MRLFDLKKPVLRLCLSIVFCFSLSLPVAAEEPLQRDWMINLVDATGWSFGLPDEPQDPDYINILAGNRKLHFEAEDIFAREQDNVSVMSFKNFGTFSGEGWLHGSREATDVHLRFNLPVDGTYQIHAQLRHPGHTFKVGEKTTTVDAEATFTKVDVGLFPLQAGAQEIIVTLPPGGSIDYISLNADNLAAITPAGGWQPDKPLSWADVQTTMLQLLQLADTFPSETDAIIIEAEKLKPTEAKVVDTPHLGRPSGGKWLRTGPLPAEVTFQADLKKSGFYDLSVRALGSPIAITVNDHQVLRLQAKAYLDDYNLEPVFLSAGKNRITMSLPPAGGVDWLKLRSRQIDATSSQALLGLSSRNNPTPQDIDTLTTILATFGVKR